MNVKKFLQIRNFSGYTRFFKYKKIAPEYEKCFSENNNIFSEYENVSRNKIKFSLNIKA